jgi:hypothetical protein
MVRGLDMVMTPSLPALIYKAKQPLLRGAVLAVFMRSKGCLKNRLDVLDTGHIADFIFHAVVDAVQREAIGYQNLLLVAFFVEGRAENAFDVLDLTHNIAAFLGAEAVIKDGFKRG